MRIFGKFNVFFWTGYEVSYNPYAHSTKSSGWNGSPQNYPDTMMQQARIPVTLELDHDLFKALEMIERQERISPSATVNDALREALNLPEPIIIQADK